MEQKTINDLIKKVMKDKNVKGYELAKLMQCSAGNITQILQNGANPWWETVNKIFKCLNQDFEILDRKMCLFNLPATIATPNKLRSIIGTFYVRMNGVVYEIIEA